MKLSINPFKFQQNHDVNDLVSDIKTKIVKILILKENHGDNAMRLYIRDWATLQNLEDYF